MSKSAYQPPGHKALKSALHHWWPRSLSIHWADEEGLVSQLWPDGRVVRAPPSNFGAITNAHHMRLGGPWDSSFEHVFDLPDREMSNLVEWLAGLDSTHANSNGELDQRILSQPLPQTRKDQLARCVASLAARSPRTRDIIRRTVEYYRGRISLSDTSADKNLIAGNQRDLYGCYQKSLASAGRWAILFSDSVEFIFGDGFLHDFPTVVGSISTARCIVPLTPTMTIAFLRPFGGYPSEPKLITIRLVDGEVQYLNDTVEACSRDFVFFRSRQPNITPAFAAKQHHELDLSRPTWLDSFLHDLSQYHEWGRNLAKRD